MGATYTTRYLEWTGQGSGGERDHSAPPASNMTNQHVCAWLCERGVTQFKPQTVTFECADCPFVGNAQVTRMWWKKMTF